MYHRRLFMLEEVENARPCAPSRFAPTTVLLEIIMRLLPPAAGCLPCVQAWDLGCALNRIYGVRRKGGGVDRRKGWGTCVVRRVQLGPQG
jgi:hypothetical protein